MSLASLEQENGVIPMQINTRFGTQEIDPESIIEFPNGLPGFEDLKRYKLFHEEEGQIVFYLQALDEAGLQLPLVDPDEFQVNYQITLSDEEIAQLELENPEDAAILVTVSKTDSDTEGDAGLHANFMGPIVINTRSRKGLQKALNKVSGTVLITAE